MRRRAYLAAVALGATGFAGCTSRDGDDTTLTSTSTSTPTTTPDDGELVSSGPGDYPHPIRVDNSLDEAVAVTIAVDRDDVQLYEATHEVPAKTERVVAGFVRETLPEGRRQVTLTAAAGPRGTDRYSFGVTDCLGDVVVFFDDDRQLQLTYSVC